MKSSLKKRIIKLEGSFNRNSRKRYAKVVYDSSSGFDSSTLEIDAEVVLFLPDNGRRGIDKKVFSNQPYKIFYE